MATRRRPASAPRRGVDLPTARSLILGLDGVVEGRSYGYPSFLVGGRFFARFRDDDTVLALQLGTMDDRDVLRQLDPAAFFFTEHYRNYPTVLIRLAEVQPAMLAEVLRDAWEAMSSRPPRRGATARRRPRRAG